MTICRQLKRKGKCVKQVWIDISAQCHPLKFSSESQLSSQVYFSLTIVLIKLSLLPSLSVWRAWTSSSSCRGPPWWRPAPEPTPLHSQGCTWERNAIETLTEWVTHGGDDIGSIWTLKEAFFWKKIQFSERVPTLACFGIRKWVDLAYNSFLKWGNRFLLLEFCLEREWEEGELKSPNIYLKKRAATKRK